MTDEEVLLAEIRDLLRRQNEILEEFIPSARKAAKIVNNPLAKAIRGTR